MKKGRVRMKEGEIRGCREERNNSSNNSKNVMDEDIERRLANLRK